MALGHELAHPRTSGWRKLLSAFPLFDIPMYGDFDEERVIKEYENPAAAILGEGLREDHRGMPTWVPTPVEAKMRLLAQIKGHSSPVRPRRRRRMVRITGLLVACICFSLWLSCGRSVSKSTTIDLTQLGRQGERIAFSEVSDVKLLPRSVLAQFTGGLADPGGQFRATDVGARSIPDRRLIVAGVSDRYVLVHYEGGGISYFLGIALFERATEKAEIVWVSGCPRATDLSQLKTLLESGSLKNRLGEMAW
jgi:hypothetical protein